MEGIKNHELAVEGFPFRHIIVDDFFLDEVHGAICAAYEKLSAEGTSDTFNPSVLSRFPGYDAHCWVFDPDTGRPLDIFYSRDWIDYFAELFGLPLAQEVVVEFHHHEIGSKEDVWHDDFNFGYFPDNGRMENGVNPWHFQCNYMDGSVAQSSGTAPILERVRAVAFIYYFGNDEYHSGSGGETGLGSKNAETGEISLFRAVEPVPNRLLAFEISLDSHHKFMTNREAERNTVIGWFHVTVEETLRRHVTYPHRWTKGDIAGGRRSPEGHPIDEVIYDRE